MVINCIAESFLTHQIRLFAIQSIYVSVKKESLRDDETSVGSQRKVNIEKLNRLAWNILLLEILWEFPKVMNILAIELQSFNVSGKMRNTWNGLNYALYLVNHLYPYY